LAQDGADVAINYEKNEQQALEVAAQITRVGVRSTAVRGSVASYEDCQTVIAEVEATFGGLDILVNNAAVLVFGKSLADVTSEEMAHVIGVNTVGAFNMSKAAIPLLRHHKRSDIIFVSSYSLTTLGRGNGPYNMSKAAVEAFACTLAKEERHNGIRVNIVSPNLTVTDMNRSFLPAFFGVADLSELDARSPFGRLGVPEDIASVVGFLVSPANEYVSGQRVVVDGACDVGMIAGRRTV
jgi:NAD(P)-dependent dehydrogenase (short-subunit alcohol dehydrogenase family)